MSQSAIRYAVIGSGMMGVEHLRNLDVLPDAQITAVCDPHEPSIAAAREAVESPDALRTFTDHRALLEARVCDAVVIATPNHLHLAPLVDALDAGLHVLVEKPLCTTIEDCRAAIAHAARHDRVVQVGLEYRYMPPVARLLSEVRAGTIGRLRMVSIREHRFPFLTKVGNWNRFTANTGGTLVEKCCHYFDLMNQITGSRPERIFASGGQDVNHLDEVYDGRRSDILDNAFVVVDYAEGVRGMLDLCMFAEASRNQEELSAVGDAGKIESLLPESIIRIGRRGTHWHDVEEHPASDERIAHTGFHHGASYLEHLAFQRAIRDDTPPEVGLEDGLWSVAMGVAAHRSIDESRPVALSEIL